MRLIVEWCRAEPLTVTPSRGVASKDGQLHDPGRALAEYNWGSPVSVDFDHPDALGSGQQWTNWAGSSVGETLFHPFGQMWGDTTGGTVFRFYASLLWYDPEVDGYQPPNRYLVPRLSRWLSPDPTEPGAGWTGEPCGRAAVVKRA